MHILILVVWLSLFFLWFLFLLPYAFHDDKHLNILFIPKLPLVFRALCPNSFVTAGVPKLLPVTGFSLSGGPYLPFSWFIARFPEAHPQIYPFHFLPPYPLSLPESLRKLSVSFEDTMDRLDSSHPQGTVLKTFHVLLCLTTINYGVPNIDQGANGGDWQHFTIGPGSR